MANFDPNVQGTQESLTPAESEAMKKCLSASVWTHSVPSAIASIALLKFLETKGYKFKLWMTASTVISASVIGRFSAMPSCLQDVIKLVPDGTLARRLGEIRARRGQTSQSSDMVSEPLDQMPVSDYDTTSSIPPLPPSVSVPGAGAGYQQTYDDLRRKNREHYISRRTAPSSPETARPPATEPYPTPNQPPFDWYSSDPLPSTAPYQDPSSPYADSPIIPSGTTEEEPKFRRPKRLNKYGDEIEE